MLIAFANVYTSKMPITACDLLHDRVLPFYENLGINVGAVLSDNGRELCGKPESHPYELLLAVEGIKHRTTNVRSAVVTTIYGGTSEVQRDIISKTLGL